jgi:putative ABC transport system permease protein
MMKKLLLTIKLTVLCVFRNNARMLLTISGISIGLIFFLIGNSFVSAYINDIYKDAYAFDKTSYIVSGSKEDREWTSNLLDKNVESLISKYSFSQSMHVQGDYKYDNKIVQNYLTLVACESEFSKSSICSYDNQAKIYVGRSTLLYGRDISNNDIKNKRPVCVIEKSTAICLFNRENAVGTTVNLNGEFGYLDLEVIGIIDDLYTTRQNNFSFNKMLSDSNVTQVKNLEYIYVPNSYFYELEQSTSQYGIEVAVHDVEIQDKGTMDKTVIMAKENIKRLSKRSTITSQLSLIEDAQYIENNIKGAMLLVLIFIGIVSGFVILTVFLFSIKERIYEIGIRRALGASANDIQIQFIGEGIILSILSAFISVIISIIICNFASFVLGNVYYYKWVLVISPELIFATFGIAIIQGILFSFVPSVAAAKVRPTEAIRWD